MSNTTRTALSLAVLAVLALAALPAEARSTPWPDAATLDLAADFDMGDGRPPTPGPTDPNGPWH